eukprot:TRINITY_DN22262_c0_g1_i1.p1 TRINITY_DN22262_c0_g1~~TRINITY_DN22262_c0_g1_i1.p1  ORF type:complete len:244 (-),score=-26.16 TRINITY_DN22262_c0_g1_i1:70-801(-)
MESCGLKCLKYTMFVFNLLFFLCGAALLAVGIWVLVDGNSFMSLVADNTVIFNAVYIIIAVGAALLVIAFFGCCGAIKENKCLLGTYFAIVLIIFIVEIIGGILAFVYFPQVESYVVNSMNDYVESSNTSVVTASWNTLQSVFQCCGYSNYSNWADSNFTSSTANAPFPTSCCTRNLNNVDAPFIDETACLAETEGSFYSIGCATKIRTYYWAVGGTCLGILVVELLAMIFTCCLSRSVEYEA